MHHSLLWSPYGIGQTIIFSSCGFFLSIYLLSVFFSSPNLSDLALDVYHTSTHGVAVMQVWNERHVARRKCRTQKGCQKSPSGHHRTTLSGYIFATKARIDNRKKIVKRQYVLQTSPQYGEHRPTNGWDRLAGLGHPIIFQWVSRLGTVTARQSSSGRQPNFVVLNRGHHLCSAGRPSRWALAHILFRHMFL